MSSGSDRFEYFRQPHVIIISVVLVFAVCAALFSGFMRFRDMQRRQSSETSQACMELVKDEALCRFAAVNETAMSQSQIITSTTTNGETTEVTTTEVESPTRMKSVTLNNLQEIEAYVVIDDTTYVKDYSDNAWAEYKDASFNADAMQNAEINYDFTSELSQDVIEFRDYYEFQSMEPCGDLTCYKYAITDPENDTATSYVWFDDQDYMLRRHLITDEDFTTNMQFSYQSVSIQPPSPTKPVSPDELEEYL